MKTNEYLYGKDVEVPQIPADIVMRRIELLKDLQTELWDVPLMDRDTNRCNEVKEAIDFWEGINDR